MPLFELGLALGDAFLVAVFDLADDGVEGVADFAFDGVEVGEDVVGFRGVAGRGPVPFRL
jgi:hypothetical protein